MSEPLFSASNITKRFGALLALDDVGIAFHPGRVTAILGENGAGKSTLAKIVAGIYAPDAGELRLEGASISPGHRAQAARAGIGYVAQALSFLPTLSLIDNHLLAGPGMLLNRREARRSLQSVLEQIGVPVPTDRPLGMLPLPLRQIGELASAVASGARLLLLDEPTSTLGPAEIDRLMEIIQRLRTAGTAIGLVTHRISEVEAVADAVVVLRGGKLVHSGPAEGLSRDAIALMMIGHAAPALVRPPRATGAVRLEARDLSLLSDHASLLDQINLQVSAGEIVGIAGVAGPGQDALVGALSGDISAGAGGVSIDGTLVVSTHGARQAGLALIPGSRATAIAQGLTVAENASLYRLAERGFSRLGLRNRKAELAHGVAIAERFDVRPRVPNRIATALSGGNQQKLLVGRELEEQPKVIIAHGPTQGLDIDAATAIRQRLAEATTGGAAVLLVSADLDELLALSHRLLVLTGGRIVAEFDLASGPPDRAALGRAMAGTANPSPTSAKEPQLSPTPSLKPLLGHAFPPHGLAPHEIEALAKLEAVLDADIAPAAAAADKAGRYPTQSIAALKRSGILASPIPRAEGGLGFSHRAVIEAELRIATADSAVAQLYKVHEELVRDLLTHIPDAHRPALLKAVIEEQKILGLASAENGRTVSEPMTTVVIEGTDGLWRLNGRKIYTTGSAEADIIVVWAFDPSDPRIAENPALGLRVNLVPAGTPGITIHRDWDALGQRATDSGAITFSDVALDPAWNGLAPDKLPPLHAPLGWQLGFAALLIGNAVGALRAAAPFVVNKSRPWPSAGVENAADDPYVRRIAGEATADLAAAYALSLSAADLLDAFERGEVGRTEVAIPIYAAKSAASRAALKATNDIFALTGTRGIASSNGFDRYWRNVRTLTLHDPLDWKHAEIGQHVLTGWNPPWGIYQ
jgi:ABC-type uncharacterized transport system ATPase subunit/alkylation response protein AidB-like acyl-CoA dehydrogenase